MKGWARVVAENIYLTKLREKYTNLKKSIEGLQAQAADAGRELTNEEMRSVVGMSDEAEQLYTQIKQLSDVEVRDAQVAKMQEQVRSAIAGAPAAGGNGGTGGTGAGAGAGEQTRAVNLGGAHTQDRDPGLYVLGGQYSFIGDQYRSERMGDREAAERLTRHSNALRDSEHMRAVLGTTTGGGVGLVPPVWLAEQFAPILHRRLRVAALLRQVPWAGPFPWTIPVASTAATTTNLAEGTNPSPTNPTYTTITVLPTTIDGYEEVSRQLLEASNPAVDSIIWGDLIGNFYDNAETNTITAIEAVSGLNLATVTGTTVDVMRGGVLDGIAAVEDNGGGDADLYFGRRARWHTYLKLADGNNRPLVVNQGYGAFNATGQGNATGGFRNTVVGELENLTVATSPTVNASRGYVVNSQELLFSISPPMQFSFEQPAGPALVRVGVWGYMACVANRRPKAITRVTYNSN